MRNLAPSFLNYNSTVIPAVLTAAGIFFAFANPFWQIPLMILALPFGLYKISFLPKGQAFKLGWMAGAVGYAASLYWLYYPLTNVGQLPVFLAIPCIMLVGVFLGLFTGGITQIFINLRLLFYKNGKTTYIGLLAIATMGGLSFGGMEQLTGCLFTGFPWFPMSAAFTVWPIFIQLAYIIGTYALSAVYASVGISLSMAMLEKGRKRIFCLIVATILSFTTIGFGALRLSEAIPQNSQFNFLLVQGNVDQNQKWDKGTTLNNIDHYIQLTKDGLKNANNNVDMVIWPETALPYVFDYRKEYSDIVLDFAERDNIVLAFGTLGYQPADTSRRAFLLNRLQIFTPNDKKNIYYDKRHLVPFGEYIPFALNFTFLENIMQGIEFMPGNTPYILPVNLKDKTQTTIGKPESVIFGPLICYESIFPEIAQSMVKNGTTIFLVISNDGWFGNSSAPHQHLALSAMRSVEQNRAMLRATNTGITASIDKYGRITQSTKLFEAQAILFQANTENQVSLFHQFKFYIDCLLWINILFCFALPKIFKIKSQ